MSLMTVLPKICLDVLLVCLALHLTLQLSTDKLINSINNNLLMKTFCFKITGNCRAFSELSRIEKVRKEAFLGGTEQLAIDL